jgi:predicted aldo/keto reductase-like oxidoreductase
MTLGNIQINLDEQDPRLLDMVSSAVLGAIDEKSRDILIQEAIKSLLTPVATNSYYSSSNPQSPLQKIFNNALESVASDAAKAALLESEDIKKLFAEEFEKIKTLDYDKKSKVLRAFATALVETIRDSE